MTLSLNAASRLSLVATAALALGTTVAPIASQAAAPYYTATLAAPADDDRAVAGGVAWACKDSTCVAAKGTSRPMRICRGLAREFGEITSFTAKGKELDADKLAKCNGK
ncbi:MAG: hypothetical protein QNI87_12515 [Erythrobacter sp.]|uniref:CC_3452 family protein n=1 Tax=Erythrobacter sp. TaxID=1042 RepID=UPI002603D029|nr:hypothetical protein [Erythrobacter sp.]MDJ0979341.1 hypothetical protein [Erythrobacter sp.]